MARRSPEVLWWWIRQHYNRPGETRDSTSPLFSEGKPSNSQEEQHGNPECQYYSHEKQPQSISWLGIWKRSLTVPVYPRLFHLSRPFSSCVVDENIASNAVNFKLFPVPSLHICHISFLPLAPCSAPLLWQCSVVAVASCPTGSSGYETVARAMSRPLSFSAELICTVMKE